MHFKSKNILIAGGAGFIGSNLSKTLLSENHNIYVVDNLLTGFKENMPKNNPRLHFYEMDITSELFYKTFQKIKLQEIYHLACATGVPNIEKLGEEMLLACSMGTKRILDLARIHNSNVIYVSSCEVYGNPKISPQKESYTGNVDCLGERSSYEEAKRFGESLVKRYVIKYNVNAKIIRPFNTYGVGMSTKDLRVIPQFLKSVKESKELCVFGDGSQTRTHLYIKDSIQGFKIVMEKGVAGDAYNLGSDRQITIKELADIVIKQTKHTKKIKFIPHFISDHNDRLPSIEKMIKLGWEQKVSLEDGLEKMIKF